MNCPCGSQQPHASCCQPILSDPTQATTAVALMRARYTAHVLGHVDFVVQTVHPVMRPMHDVASIRRWMDQTVWEGLSVKRTTKGQPNDVEGWVWFEAAYRKGQQRAVHRERSLFRKMGPQWYFVEGKEPPLIQAAPKVARNAPCPCGSGKKYKRCCAPSRSKGIISQIHSLFPNNHLPAYESLPISPRRPLVLWA